MDVNRLSAVFPFQNVLRPHQNVKQAFSNSSGLKSVNQKLGLRDRLVDCRPDRRNKSALSNFSGVV